MRTFCSLVKKRDFWKGVVKHWEDKGFKRQAAQAQECLDDYTHLINKIKANCD